MVCNAYANINLLITHNGNFLVRLGVQYLLCRICVYKQRECLVTKDYISVKTLHYFNASLDGQNFYFA